MRLSMLSATFGLCLAWQRSNHGTTLAFAPSLPATRSAIAIAPQCDTRLFLRVDGKTTEGGIETFVPTNNMVLLKKTGPVEATEGGLFLTGKSKEKKTEGVVIAAGPGKTHQDTGTYYPMPVSVHDVVVYPKGCGTDLEIDGEKYLLIMDDDVLVRYPGSEDGETDQTIANAAVIRDNVLVEVEQKQKTNAVATGGILLAKSSTSEKRPSVGTVVKVGPGRLATNGEIMPMEVQVDDMIKFRDFAGASVTIDDLEYIVVRMMDIVAKF